MSNVLMMGLTPPEEGGSERHIYEIASRIENCTVLTQKGTFCKKKIELPVLTNSTFARNMSFFILSIFYTLFLLTNIKKKYDTIHIHENLLYFLVPFLRLRYNVVVTMHGIKGFKYYDKKILWLFFKNSLSFTDKIISVSLADKELLDGEFNNVIYIPNGVNLDTYKKISKPKIQRKITFVGRIHKQKGLEYLIKAFQNLNQKVSQYKLNIIGKKKGQLYKMLSKKYKNKNIIWKGFVSDRKKLFIELASSEILVFPSVWEALPWPALLEGLGSNRPVIASDLYGMRKIFKDKKDIVLTPIKNPMEIEKAMTYLIKNKKTAIKIGKNGGNLSKKYTWNNIAEKVQNLYKGLLISE